MTTNSTAHESHLATTTGLDHRKLLMWTFLASECLFFGSLIATFLLYKDASVVGPYPHEILNIPVTSTSTFVLLTSSLAMVLALAAVQRSDVVSARFLDLRDRGAGRHVPRLSGV